MIIAFGTTEATKVCIGVIIVFILCFTADTVAGVRKLCGYSLQSGRAVDSIPTDRIRKLIFGEGSSERTVSVETKDGAGNSPNSLTDIGKSMCDLSISVQLITKQVGYDYYLWAQLSKNSAGGRLIAFDYGIHFLHSSIKRAIHGKLSQDTTHQVCP